MVCVHQIRRLKGTKPNKMEYKQSSIEVNLVYYKCSKRLPSRKYLLNSQNVNLLSKGFTAEKVNAYSILVGTPSSRNRIISLNWKL